MDNESDSEEDMLKKDLSVTVRKNDNGAVVESAFISTNADGHKFVKLSVRNTRIPEIGDKFSRYTSYEIEWLRHPTLLVNISFCMN